MMFWWPRWRSAVNHVRPDAGSCGSLVVPLIPTACQDRTMTRQRPRILLTNDDGIDSVGLHLLARAMCEHGEVIVVAPDREFSGAGAAVGALHLIQPEVHRVTLQGVDEAWTVGGPPALCVMFARLGAFG